MELVYNKYTNKYQNKTKMVQMNKISNCNIIFVVMFIYLIWMEVALYIKLQQLPSLADRYVKLFIGKYFQWLMPVINFKLKYYIIFELIN